ncbi:DUF2147 domain-containing protein [Laribacter hongkongensis]|uniref:Putative signal peptide protein n=1 Tax=Laribacter hongkongensis (strain HLHK9) TaxID=557598 RepID=C1D8S3_LARHH|nr:DUF2147 domain-containing protein [Laribacter hongkongensis]ACO74863.1 putative signal peptide protein [Laribacter hongkongensis HLHK9]MCG9051638.1 DUF2147 domain-containing protein [Laribacter hongkongensis]MCG9082291.1 DUF2147 domain-containing protein [Laribacter hongkongensis]MCG9115106.1 DUF2147 domain-containing protein [Laribacter hongkongensis]MCG9123165.1 DUF2147 domain-containing protein [Laribacter hongkongensis]
MKLKPALCAVATLLACSLAQAEGIAGTWKTIDDETRQPKALVQITENGNEYQGKIIKLFANPDVKCSKCEGDRKDKPVDGMTILWGLKKTGETYEGGKILDPKNGKIYDSKAKLVDGGQKLEVRGFMGVSLLGRTQTWDRQ